MKRTCAFLGLMILPAILAFSQSPEPKFEVADVHSSPRTTLPVVRGPFFSSGRYELRFASMLDMIRIAYNVDQEKVTGGPNWLEMDRFDVFAKIPSGSTAESRRAMLKSLLADRFKLTVHNGSSPMAAYALTVGKRGQLKEAEGSDQSSCKFDIQNAVNGPPAGGGPITLPTIVYTCKNMSMASFAAGMLDMAGSAQYLNNKLVVDKTGIEGSWDFILRYTPKVPAGLPTTGENIPFFDALEKQLGLKLEPSTVPMPVILVDNVNRKPTENSAEAMKAFPPLPEEFEVASLKPVDPSAAGGRGAAAPRPDIKNGRLYLPGFNLKTLIQVAWEINGDELMAGLQRWMDDDRYDILAKAPADVALGELIPQRNGVSVNIDALRPMLRALIKERFKLEFHMEERPLNAYTLVATKPKLKKADPASRTRWQEGAAPDAKGKNANASLGRLVTCQNVTMAQFAEMLPGIAPGYLRTDVADATGLEGGWDFTFSFSPVGAGQAGRGGGRDGGRDGGGGSAQSPAGEASEPSDAVPLFDALQQQLGLKLEMHKRPTKVLVIDRVERKPIEN